MYIAPLRPKTQARSKPDTVDRPVRTARIFVHHYNSTQYCHTESIYISFPPDNITSHMWPSGGRGAVVNDMFNRLAKCVQCTLNVLSIAFFHKNVLRIAFSYNICM